MSTVAEKKQWLALATKVDSMNTAVRLGPDIRILANAVVSLVAEADQHDKDRTIREDAYVSLVAQLERANQRIEALRAGIEHELTGHDAHFGCNCAPLIKLLNNDLAAAKGESHA